MEGRGRALRTPIHCEARDAWSRRRVKMRRARQPPPDGLEVDGSGLLRFCSGLYLVFRSRHYFVFCVRRYFVFCFVFFWLVLFGFIFGFIFGFVGGGGLVLEFVSVPGVVAE